MALGALRSMLGGHEHSVVARVRVMVGNGGLMVGSLAISVMLGTMAVSLVVALMRLMVGTVSRRLMIILLSIWVVVGAMALGALRSMLGGHEHSVVARVR